MTNEILVQNGGKAKEHTVRVCWDAVNSVVRMLASMTRDEFEAYFEANQGKLSEMEHTIIANRKDPKMIWAILDRVLGKATQPVEVEHKAITHEDILNRIEAAKREKAIETTCREV